jgi:endonuclease/exonuclease/phosphatase family metal-dependent hydrolase
MPPSAASDRAALDQWCAAVGPVTVSTFAPLTESPPSVVVVVTWNIHVGAGDIGALVASLRRGDLAGTAGADIVLLLQETVRRSDDVPVPVPAGARRARRIGMAPPGHDVVAAARALQLNLAYVPSMRNGDAAEDRGNAILTTLPLESIEAVELPLGHQRRVAVAATIAPPRSIPPFRVVNAHLDTALRFGAGGPATWRRHQAGALVEVFAGSEVPTIVAGDFNTWWGTDEPAVRDLLRAFPGIVDRGGRETWRGPLAAGARLDHIFASGWRAPLEARRVPQRFGSDHYPLYVVVTGERRER